MKRKIHNLKHLKSFRKDLRNRGTSSEAFLWKHLKNSQLSGRKFRRQHSIENYIVDFYCPKERLIIELDGEIHLNPSAEEKDNFRTERLEALGFTVIRFENRMVFDLLPSVLRELRIILKTREKPLRLPLKKRKSPPLKKGKSFKKNKILDFG